MNKKSYFDAAAWQVSAVASALRANPSLARAVDARGRTALHRCAGTDAAKAAQSIDDGLDTAAALLSAGADLNAVHLIRTRALTAPGREQPASNPSGHDFPRSAPGACHHQDRSPQNWSKP